MRNVGCLFCGGRGGGGAGGGGGRGGEGVYPFSPFVFFFSFFLILGDGGLILDGNSEKSVKSKTVKGNQLQNY